MPDFASCRLASTSWLLLPMDETMPIPVMTTRLMSASPYPCVLAPSRIDADRLTMQCAREVPKNSSSRRCGALLEQTDLQILGAINNLAVHGKPPVGDTEHQ